MSRSRRSLTVAQVGRNEGARNRGPLLHIPSQQVSDSDFGIGSGDDAERLGGPDEIGKLADQATPRERRVDRQGTMQPGGLAQHCTKLIGRFRDR